MTAEDAIKELVKLLRRDKKLSNDDERRIYAALQRGR